jgi:hypothetical protein
MRPIEKELSEMEAELARINGIVDEEDDASLEDDKEPEQEEEETIPEEVAPEEAPPVEQPQEQLEEKKEEIDASAYARMRRELAAERKRNEELARKVSSPEQAPEQENLYARELERIIEKNRREEAAREFVVLEESFKRSVPDYDAVIGDYVPNLVQAIRIQNPRISEAQAQEEAQNVILRRASEYLRNGFDPIQELYEEAKSLGYGKSQPQRQQAVEAPVKKQEVKKPDYNKLAENRVRNSGMAAAKGVGKSLDHLTLESIASMKPKDMARLTKAQMDEVSDILKNGFTE